MDSRKGSKQFGLTLRSWWLWFWWDCLECSWFSRLVEMAGVSPLESHEARMTETSNLGDQNFHPLSCVMCDFQVGKGGSKCWFLDVIMPLVSNLPNTVQDLRMINDIMAKPDWIMFGEVEYFMTVLVRFQLIFLNDIKYPACRELSPYRPYQELISNDIFIISWTKKRF